MTDYGTLLRDHVTLRCQSIDRIFLQAYVPRLQAVGDVCTFLRWQRKYPIPSSAAFVQFEIADTRVFDRPPAGRMWFAGVIREGACWCPPAITVWLPTSDL